MGKKGVCRLVLSLFLVSLGGLLIHLRIHPLSAGKAANWTAFVFGLTSTLAVPVMFYYRGTAKWAWILNLAAVAVGTLGMGHEGLERLREAGFSLSGLIFDSLLADIFILWAKVGIGQVLLHHHLPENGSQEVAGESAK